MVSYILCPWCNAPWSDDNMQLYDLDAGDQCDSGRFGPESVSIKITCHACHRLMYQKDGVEVT
jgi:hypothetical protein